MAHPRASLIALLEEAGRAHHQAFLSTDGHDPHWPEWYAAYLGPRLAAITDAIPRRAELADMLTMADARHREQGGDLPWPAFYADLLIAALGTATDTAE